MPSFEVGEHLEAIPILDKVCIRRDVAPEKLGAIYIPQTLQEQEQPLTGTVISIGPNVDQVQPGDRVVFGQYAGIRLIIDDEQFVIMLQKDIHCKLVPKEE